MATPNYSYEKRQRELAKKRKAEEKKQKKAVRPADGQPDDAPEPDGETDNTGGGSAPPPAV